MRGTCYGVRATLLGFSNRRKGSVHRIDVGAGCGGGGQSWVSSALYCSVLPAEETFDVAYYYRTTHVCSRGLSSVRP